MKRWKNLLFISAAVVCSLPLGTKADFSGFVEQLRQNNIPIDAILTQTGISRYELTRLLNAVECKDCVNPDNEYIQAYTAQFWSKFSKTEGKDFDDISYANAMFNKKNYFYCVAYVGDNGYMNGYPITSPVCTGKFCGNNTVTKAEFLQVVINMIGKYIYSTYALNWEEAKSWISKFDTTSYEYRTFSSQQIAIIKDKAKTCTTKTCLLESTEELNIYLKYCMFNLKSCGMIPLDKIKEGYWPVAELNLLNRQQIVSIDQAASYNVNELIAGDLVMKIFSNMSTIIGCSFDIDYDCDSIPNTEDNCPNAYNPSQTDADKDGIGDVCDDDIDNDGIKNPIGIVDDTGKINIKLRNEKMDNCLFTVNSDQKKSEINKYMGSICDTIGDNLSLAIAIPKITGVLPQTVDFEAIHVTAFSQYSWDFGDGSFSNGEYTNHTYTKPGVFLVRLLAKTKSGVQSLAKTTIVVGHNASEKRAIQPFLKTISIQKNATTTLSLSSIGDFDYFERKFSDGTMAETKSTTISKVFRSDGSIQVLVKGFKNKEIVAISSFNITIGNKQGAVLNASLLNPDKETTVSFSTIIAGFSSKDIRTVTWDFGDGTTIQTQKLNISHLYKKSGQKVVIQTIALANGSTIKSMLTLYVVRPYLFDSYSISFLPDMNGSIMKAISFTSKINGSFDTPIAFRTTYGDTFSQNFGLQNIRSPFVSQHQYRNASIYYPQTSLVLDACINVSAQATVDISGKDICLEAKMKGTLKSLGCDMDSDGIPDMCDTDIDGDGITNLLGIISDPKQCKYISELQTNGIRSNMNEGPFNHEILNKHFEGVCSLDNDPFQSNTNQVDANNNNIGDSLDTAIVGFYNGGKSLFQDSFIDSDNDGIPDSQDICPLLGETYNGIEDTDGCPEIGVELNCEDSRLPIINEIQYICGNGKIDPGETCQTCPADAGVCSPNCGNGKIDPGETCQTCPSDVGSCTSICGNTIAEAGETCTNCPSDIGTCNLYCGNGVIDPNETCQTCPSDVGSCTSICGNGIIDPGETCKNCPKDAGICNPNCGNGVIDPNETCQTCPSDVGSCTSICGNGTIDPGETCKNCPKDIPSCNILCGNGIIDPGETCKNCPIDIPSCNILCGNGIIDPGETCKNCPIDVQRCFSNCGDGMIDKNLSEQCDNGVSNNGKDGKCSSLCTLINSNNCGNGKIDSGETCNTCPIDVQRCFPLCGNGIIEYSLKEQCDNGVSNNGKDGKCSSLCTLINSNNCGNGKIDPGETCETCAIDIERCFPLCGNGITEPELGEECDNGIKNNGKDGICGERCTLLNTCGNGIQDGGEDCFSCPQDSKGCLVIVAKECLQCPCPYADYSSILTNGDKIRAILWDKGKKYLWSYAPVYEIEY